MGDWDVMEPLLSLNHATHNLVQSMGDGLPTHHGRCVPSHADEELKQELDNAADQIQHMGEKAVTEHLLKLANVTPTHAQLMEAGRPGHHTPIVLSRVAEE